jgi:hypothetical protein
MAYRQSSSGSRDDRLLLLSLVCQKLRAWPTLVGEGWIKTGAEPA